MEFLKTIKVRNKYQPDEFRTYYSSDYFINTIEIASRKNNFKDWTIEEVISKIAQTHKVPVKELVDVWTRYKTAKVKEEADYFMNQTKVQAEWEKWKRESS